MKVWCLPNHAWHNIPPISWSLAPLSHVVTYVRLIRQKRRGSWRLSPLRGLSSPAPLCSAPTMLWTPAVFLSQENPTPQETAALTELENEQQQWARRQYVPQGGSNLSQQPPVSLGSYLPSASIFNPECSRFPNKSSNGMTPTTKVAVRYMCIYSREYLTQKNKDPHNPQRDRKKTYALIMSVSSAAP